MDNEPQLELPSGVYCPITQEVMEDPVVDPEGHSYEKRAIEEWLSKHSTSPFSRAPLTVRDLVPNRDLKTLIQNLQLREKAKPATNKGNVRVREEPVEIAEDEEGRPTKVDIIASSAAELGEDTNALDHYVLINIRPEVGAARTPVDIVCVVDVSGSMGFPATLKTNDGEVQSTLSLLDIVKHATNTIVHALQDTDRVAIVTYSSDAREVVQLTYTTDDNKGIISAQIDELYPLDRTDIWKGLKMGLDILRENRRENCVSSLFLLTDGWPNFPYPKKEHGLFADYVSNFNLQDIIVNSFGFGYDMNSELLEKIAIIGNGMYSFIPDSAFVGTTFVNGASNILVTMATNVKLVLKPQNGASIVKILGYPFQIEKNSMDVSLASIQHGQNIGVVVKMKIPEDRSSDSPYLEANLEFKPWNSNEKKSIIAVGKDIKSAEFTTELQVQRHRLMVVGGISDFLEARKENAKVPAPILVQSKFTEELRKGPDPRQRGLFEDVRGQISQAITDRYYRTWGQHYLPSLMRAHLLQQRNNFKDPGIQFYGGKIFCEIYRVVNNLFSTLPAPKQAAIQAPTPTVSKETSKTSGSASTPRSRAAQPAPRPQAILVNMAAFNNSEGSCFDGECSVLTTNGRIKKVKDIKKGDLVSSGNGKWAKIRCVVKTHCRENVAKLVAFENGLLVTPYHPVRLDGVWRFPLELGEVKTRSCAAVYSFVLDRDSAEHVMIINGIECVTLGHNYVDSDVVRHSYFGSQKVLDDLAKMKGWENGTVELSSGCQVKDPKTGLVCALRQ